MAIGERIRYFRNLRGMTQKHLGMLLGFPERSADIRVAQYETSVRTPKKDMTDTIARTLDVTPAALEVPDIDTLIGLMHTLFTLEDLYGLRIGEQKGENEGEPYLYFSFDDADEGEGIFVYQFLKMFRTWKEKALQYQAGEISKEEYDRWRHNYPDENTEVPWIT